MSAALAHPIEDPLSLRSANDNAPISARAKLKLRLVGRWEFGSQDQISRHLYDGNLKRVGEADYLIRGIK